jgi:hypothetical protein
MKQKRSMDEALDAAKRMRHELSTKQEKVSVVDSHLAVVESEEPHGTEENSIDKHKTQGHSMERPLKPVWVRHTVGLHDTTSLSLRDAAEGQKRKERHGHLGISEPANEQEIADLGIRLALQQLGYLSD